MLTCPSPSERRASWGPGPTDGEWDVGIFVNEMGFSGFPFTELDKLVLELVHDMYKFRGCQHRRIASVDVGQQSGSELWMCSPPGRQEAATV